MEGSSDNSEGHTLTPAGEAALRRQREQQEVLNRNIEAARKQIEEKRQEYSQIAEREKEKEIKSTGSSDHISLKVVSQDGNEVYFKIKRKTCFRKLFDAYCARQAISPSSVRFLYDGSRVMPDSNPEKLDMENDDIIDVVLQQTGGQ